MRQEYPRLELGEFAFPLVEVWHLDIIKVQGVGSLLGLQLLLAGSIGDCHGPDADGSPRPGQAAPLDSLPEIRTFFFLIRLLHDPSLLRDRHCRKRLFNRPILIGFLGQSHR